MRYFLINFFRLFSQIEKNLCFSHKFIVVRRSFGTQNQHNDVLLMYIQR